ncbi:MAG: hypothetical protein ACKVP5_07805 [Aestuariivirga sp.]
MWHSSWEVPLGWALCNGRDGTLKISSLDIGGSALNYIMKK